MAQIRIAFKVLATLAELQDPDFIVRSHTLYKDGSTVYFAPVIDGNSKPTTLSAHPLGATGQAIWDADDVFYIHDNNNFTPNPEDLSYGTIVCSLTSAVGFDNTVTYDYSDAVDINYGSERLKLSAVLDYGNQPIPNNMIFEKDSATSGVPDDSFTTKYKFWRLAFRGPSEPRIGEVSYSNSLPSDIITNADVGISGGSIPNLTDGDPSTYVQWRSSTGYGRFYVERADKSPFHINYFDISAPSKPPYEYYIGGSNEDVATASDVTTWTSVLPYSPFTHIGSSPLRIYGKPNKPLANVLLTGTGEASVSSLLSLTELNDAATASESTAIDIPTVADIDERDLLSLSGNRLIYVADATADPSVSTGGAIYDWNNESRSWTLFHRDEPINQIDTNEW